MQTPYTSFATVDKFLSKEYPVPTSSYTMITQNQLEMFLGLSSDQLQNFTNTITQAAGAFKAVKQAVKSPVLTPPIISTPAYTPPPAEREKKSNVNLIIGISAGVVALIVTVIVILKIRKR